MKKFLTSFCLFVSVFCLCFGLTACGKEKNSDTFKVTANNLTTEYYTTGTVSFENLTLTLTYASLVTETLTIFDIDPELDDDENWTASSDDTEFAIFTNGLSSQTAGELVAGTYKITARIIGYSGEYTLGTVTVKTETEADTYNLVSFDYSDEINHYYERLASVSDDEEDESYFSTSLQIDGKNVYEVGDDNEFIFKPVSRLIAIGDDTTNIVTLNIAVTVSVTDLSGVAQDDTIYTFNSETYGFQFSEDAVGNVYIIYMKPTNFDKDYFGHNISELELIVYVEDGWNAYTAQDLGRINLLSNEDIASINNTYSDTSYYSNSSYYSYGKIYYNEDGTYERRYYYKIWSDFYIENGVFSSTSEIQTINAIFIHSDITITSDDIPEDYFVTSTESTYAAGSLRDYSFLYCKFLLEDEKFTFGGNYFTIDASSIEVGKSYYNDSSQVFTLYIQATANMGHSTLFAFGGANENYDCEVIFRNVFSKGNSGVSFSSTYDEDSGKYVISNDVTLKSGSLTFFKSMYTVTAYIDNCIVNQYLVAYMCHMDAGNNLSEGDTAGNLILTNSKAFDCFSSGLYSWCSLYNTIENCVFKRFGGPVIVSVSTTSSSDSVSSTTAGKTSSTSTWEVDDDSILESYVDCTEAWFVLNAATAFATSFANLNSTLSNYSKTIYNSDSKFNFIMVALDSNYLSASYPYVHTMLTSSGDSTTYGFDTDALIYQSYSAYQNYSLISSLPAILATNGGNVIATNFDSLFMDLTYTNSYYSAPTSITGTKLYMYLPYGSAGIGAVIDLY